MSRAFFSGQTLLFSRKKHKKYDTIKVVIDMSVMLYGKNPAIEVLKSNRKIIRAVILEHSNRDLYEKLQARNVPITVMNKSRFSELYSGVNQGIVIEVEDYQLFKLEEIIARYPADGKPLFVMLDGIQDPHNLGAIIRSAEAGGAKAIILPKNRAVSVNATVVKAASGAIEYLDIAEVTNLNQSIATLKKAGFWIIGTAAEAEKVYDEIFIDRPVCLVIGSEGKGISRLVRENCDLLVKIPMSGRINSLNASVSAGIIIFDILRRKKG